MRYFAILSSLLLVSCSSSNMYYANKYSTDFTKSESQPCDIGSLCKQNIDGVDINYQVKLESKTTDYLTIKGNVNFYAPGIAIYMQSGVLPVLFLDSENKSVCEKVLYFRGPLIIDSKFVMSANLTCHNAQKTFIPMYNMQLSDGWQVDDYRAIAK